MSRPKTAPLTLRPATPEDADFLLGLYTETRAREMDATGWSEAFRAAFLAGQFEAQQTSYRREFPDARFDLILSKGQPVGRLYVARQPEAMAVVDITLLAAYQGRGWGTAVIQEIMAEGDRLNIPVRLHVDVNNRARRLYARLGFQETGRDGFYLRLERPPGRDETRA